jgi:ornithine decarboxylase
MLQGPVLVSDPVSWLTTAKTDLPVQFYSAAALDRRHQQFRAGFPGEVTFAVKANPGPVVLAQLVVGGMRSFDVASPEEIALVRAVLPDAALHYHNPVRSMAEIACGLAAGVTSWSVDDVGELNKLIRAGVTGEVAVRFALPVRGAAYDFGAKFGATPAEAVDLLRAVALAGLTPSLTFHVGTQCRTPAPWAAYLAQAAQITAEAGVVLHRLNVGGGFPAARDGVEPDYESFFKVIRSALDLFALPPLLVCEPGRGLVADAFAYAVQVKSLRKGRVYLNDGIYGGLSEFPSIGLPAFRVIGPQGQDRTGPAQPVVVYGPTCDSLDHLPGDVALPTDLSPGDWLLFRAMGAYMFGVTTRFNGYGDWQNVAVTHL